VKKYEEMAKEKAEMAEKDQRMEQAMMNCYYFFKIDPGNGTAWWELCSTLLTEKTQKTPDEAAHEKRTKTPT
jgi:hypothetical protein